MLKQIESIIATLKSNNETIATMESCTGGALANLITNIEGASSVFKFGAVTYSNEYKIKFGVSKETIDTYTVYSKEVACEMSKAIASYTSSDYGIGVTGQLRKKDPNNPTQEDDKVYIAIYNKKRNCFYDKSFIVTKNTRDENKQIVLSEIINLWIEKNQ